MKPGNEPCPDGCCECSAPEGYHDEGDHAHPNGCCQHGFGGRPATKE